MKFTDKVKTSLLAGISSLLLMASAHAQITQYDTRDDFNATFPTPDLVENWDDNAFGTIIPAGSSLDGITYQTNLNGLGIASSGSTTTLFNLLSGSVGLLTTNDYVTFEFETELSSFAIDIIDSNSNTSDGLYQVTTSAGDIITSKNDPFNGRTSYHSINFSSETPFNTVRLENTSNVLSSIWNLDTLRGVSAPPTAPGSLGSLPLLVIILLGLRKRFNQRC